MNNKPIKSIAIIHIFIFALFFLGCGGTSSDKFLKTSSGNNSSITMGKIQGTVVSSDTKLGLAGAIVEAYQSQAITDNEGNCWKIFPLETTMLQSDLPVIAQLY